MPTAVVADVQYDWAARYADIESKTISGFTNTRNDKNAVYAFKIERGKTNLIEVMWKKTASDAHWLGADHQVGSPGFVLLRSFPQSNSPEVIPADDHVTATAYVNQCTGERMRELAENHLGSKEDSLAAMKWLRDTMITGSMPHTVLPNQGIVTKADWGPRIKIGIPGYQGDFYSMREDAEEDSKSFWDLPADLKQRAESIRSELLHARDLVSNLPNIRYSDLRPGAARAMQQAAALAAAPALDPLAANSENAPDLNEQKEFQSEEREWGADVAGCIVGHFAICEQKSDGGEKPGIEVVRITEVNLEVKDKETFKGAVYGPATYDTSHPKCLQGIWNRKVAATTSKKRKAQAVSDLASTMDVDSNDDTILTMPCWSVFVYFKAFTQGRKIPKPVVDALCKIAEANDHVLFEELDIDSGDEYE